MYLLVLAAWGLKRSALVRCEGVNVWGGGGGLEGGASTVKSLQQEVFASCRYPAESVKEINFLVEIESC